MPFQKSRPKAKEVETQAENELRNVHQQFRIMEDSRRAYNDWTQFFIQRQKKELSLLAQVHEEIILDLNLTKSPKNMAKNTSNAEELKSLLDNKDDCDLHINEEKAVIARLDAQIKEMEDNIIKQKSLMSVLKSAEQSAKLLKRIQTLESQLNQATINFDDMLTKNGKLREEIDHLRFQRAAFDTFCKKLLRRLYQQKIIMNTVIEESTVAYDQRIEAQARITAMKERRAKDIATYNIEIKELLRIFDHENKLKEFMQFKSSERLEFGEAEIRFKREALAEEKVRKAKAEIIESYQAVYDLLVKPTAQEDVDLLIAQFIEKEERNFASFTYLNEMHNEADSLQGKIHDLEDEMTNLQSEHRHANEDKHGILKDLEVQLQKITEEVNLCEQEYKESSKILDQLMISIENLFKAINCDPTSIQHLLGGTEGITQSTMMHYFSIIEDKANELLRIQAFKRLTESVEEPDISNTALNPFLGGSGLLGTASPIKIGLPIVLEESEPEETDETEEPFELEVLKKMIRQRIIIKEQGKDSESQNVASKHPKDRRSAIAT